MGWAGSGDPAELARQFYSDRDSGTERTNSMEEPLKGLTLGGDVYSAGNMVRPHTTAAWSFRQMWHSSSKGVTRLSDWF